MIFCFISGFNNIISQRCLTTLRTSFECDRFQGVDNQAYNQCKMYLNTLHFNVQTPQGGTPIQLAVEMDGPGFRVFKSALKNRYSI